MSRSHYRSVQEIMATLKELGINKEPKPEPVDAELEREKLLGAKNVLKGIDSLKKNGHIHGTKL